MKTINLFVDFEFTSLSPDAQPISVGIVSEDFDSFSKRIGKSERTYPGKSFYAEFSDFDLKRCDDWVRENVVGKLIGKGQCDNEESYSCIYGNTETIKFELKEWLSQFSDYQIQFVVDCGTWDWYHLIQLIGSWDTVFLEYNDGESVYMITEELGLYISCMEDYDISKDFKTGLPKLPSNISPVPFDLNDLIAVKKGISPKEAFDLSRDALYVEEVMDVVDAHRIFNYEKSVHNALFDAKVIKVIYNKLINQ